MAAKVAQGVGFFCHSSKSSPVTAIPVRTACVCSVPGLATQSQLTPNRSRQFQISYGPKNDSTSQTFILGTLYNGFLVGQLIFFYSV